MKNLSIICMALMLSFSFLSHAQDDLTIDPESESAANILLYFNSPDAQVEFASPIRVESYEIKRKSLSSLYVKFELEKENSEDILFCEASLTRSNSESAWTVASGGCEI